MKLKFSGYKRKVRDHQHEVVPIKGDPNQNDSLGEPGEPLQWDSAFHAKGKVGDLSLTGGFYIEFEFRVEELRSWLSAYARENPEEALRLLGEMQVEAITNLIARAQEAAQEAI